VILHPEDGLYVGDLVSFEVLTPPDMDTSGQSLHVRVNSPGNPSLGEAEFGTFGIGGRPQATLQWAWDTGDLDPGEYTLTFDMLPDGPSWTQTVHIQPADAIPTSILFAEWESVSTSCCTIHYVSDTAADRDLDLLVAEIEGQAQVSSQRMGSQFPGKLSVVLLPRVLGHGGFASSDISISYLDRNYAGSNLGMVLHHEMVHIIDTNLGGDYRPSLFVEGLAVYISRGHFKIEPLLSRAAVLLDLGWYIPLNQLVEDFYFQQHEIGYLEAGALIEFLVDNWGFEKFNNFYRHIQMQEGESPSQWIDQALLEHFDVDFQQLEQRFLNSLRAQVINPDLRTDVMLTVGYFDAVRRYQLNLDRSAYFLTAWLFDFNEMESKGEVADYLRHPSEPGNLALETMLGSADLDFQMGRYIEAKRTITAVNAALDRIERGLPHPFSAHPIAEHYYAIVNTLVERGYQPQQIRVKENSAQVWVSTDGPELIELSLVFKEQVWLLE
jgi:hypothetical protein